MQRTYVRICGYFLLEAFLAAIFFAVFFRAAPRFSTAFSVFSTTAAPPSMKRPTVSSVLPSLVARRVAVCAAFDAFFATFLTELLAFLAVEATRFATFFAPATGLAFFFFAADLRTAMKNLQMGQRLITCSVTR